MSWRDRKLYLENLLEGTGAFRKCGIDAEADIPQCRTGVIRQQQASSKRKQTVENCLRKREKTGLPRLVPRLLRAQLHCGLAGNAGKDLQGR